MKQTWNNHDIPANFENFLCVVTKRGNQLFLNVGFNSVSRIDEPYHENGIDIFLRHSWGMAHKICWSYVPTPEERGKVLRYIRKTFFADAIFFKHVAGKEST